MNETVKPIRHIDEPMARTPKNYRLPDETIQQIEELALKEETSYTNAIVIAVAEALNSRRQNKDFQKYTRPTYTVVKEMGKDNISNTL